MEIDNLVNQYLDKNDPSGWFEVLYTQANHDPTQVPWATLEPTPQLIQWLQKNKPSTSINNKPRAVVVGCGLGDDAQALANSGYDVTAFDISTTAINWCEQRFPDFLVNYLTADLLALPQDWQGKFDFVWECRTIQALPLNIRGKVISAIASLLKPNGKLLLLTHFQDNEKELSGPPWALSPKDLEKFIQQGLREKYRTTTPHNSKPINIACVEYVNYYSDNSTTTGA